MKKPDHRAEDAERHVAAGGGGALEQRLRALGHPALHLRDRHRRVVAHPGHPAADVAILLQAVQQILVGEEGGAAQVGDESPHLSGERHADDRQRRQHQERCEHGEDAGRPGAAALQAPRQPLVQRIENEGEHRGPADDAAQRHEQRVQPVGEDRAERDHEAAAVEGGVHGAASLAGSARRREPVHAASLPRALTRGLRPLALASGRVCEARDERRGPSGC